MREDFSSLFEGLFVQNPIVRIVMKKKNRNQLKKENSMEVGLFGTEEGDEVSIITLECKL